MKRHNQTLFTVVSSTRSGSTWFIDLLNNHEHVRAYGEIFNSGSRERHVHEFNRDLVPKQRFIDYLDANGGRRPIVTFRYLDEFVRSHDNVDAIGFKLIDGQLSSYPEILLKLVISRYRIIHLVRDNALDVVVSRLSARNRDVWHTLRNERMPKLHVDVKTVIPQLRDEMRKRALVRALLKLLPVSVLNISYEGLCRDSAITLCKVEDFLGVPHSAYRIESRLHRILKGGYEEKIQNWAEVEEVVGGSEYSRFLGNG